MRSIIIKHALPPGVSNNALQRVTPGSIKQYSREYQTIPTRDVLSSHLHNWYVDPSYIYPASQGSKACMGSDVPYRNHQICVTSRSINQYPTECYSREYQWLLPIVLAPIVLVDTTHSEIVILLLPLVSTVTPHGIVL